MKNKTKTAVILVDILNDFVTGKLKCERAESIIEPNVRLVEAARKNGIPVIYSNDAHIKNVDKELDFWGDHAIIGTEGAEVIEHLKPKEDDFVIPKRRYSGFFQTDLHLLLEELGIKHLIITGLHTNMCVRHTTADAFFWNYSITVPKETTEAFTEKDYEEGLVYLEKVYGAKIRNVDEVIKELG